MTEYSPRPVAWARERCEDSSCLVCLVCLGQASDVAMRWPRRWWTADACGLPLMSKDWPG